MVLISLNVYMINYFQAFQTALFYKKKTCLKCLSLILTCFQTSQGLVVKTKTKAQKKLTIEMLSQIFTRVASLGCQRLKILTKSIFFIPLRENIFKTSDSQNQSLQQKSETTFLIVNSFFSAFIIVLITRTLKVQNMFKLCVNIKFFIPESLQ